MNVKEYSYRKGKYSFSILNLGCAVTSICTPDRDGKMANITLPYKGVAENPEILTGSDKFLGLTVGRFANRIGGATFTVDGKTYKFEPNDNGRNLLHSGPGGIWKRIWNVKHMDDGFLCSIKVSEEDDGFPGTADIRVRFSLSEDGVFRIHYSATCTEPCPLNLTNHTYFNLTGDPSKDILSHRAVIDSHNVLGMDDAQIPDGSTIPVAGTAWDFTTERTFGEKIDAPELAGTNVPDEYRMVVDGIDALLARHGYERCGGFYKAVKPNNDTIVLFCHLAVQAVFVSHMLGISPIVMLQGFGPAPTGVTTIATEERVDGIAAFRVLSYGSTGHLYAGGEEPSFAGRFCECFSNTDQKH